LREDYGAAYRELYKHHWWWRARERIILELLRTRQPVNGWDRILDVGCGDGLFFDELLHFGELEGVEATASLVSENGPHRSRIHIGSFDRSLGLAPGFSLVLMLDVLEHLTDPRSALHYARELLVPGGILLVTVPAFNLLWTNHDVINQHYTRYSRKSFRILAGLDMCIEVERYFFHWLFPVKIATRIVEGVLRHRPAPAKIPAAWINHLLYQFCRLEEETWGRLSLPFGSSLMVILSKPLCETRKD